VNPWRRSLFTTLLACAMLAAQDAEVEARQHFLAARQAQDAGELDIAAQEYAAVLHLQPSIAEVYANLGLVYHLQGKYRESVRALAKAASLKPGMRGVGLFLGIDYVKLSEPKQAVPWLKMAVEQEPGNREARAWLGTALWDAAEAGAAIRELRDAAKNFPSDSDILFLLGQAYRSMANQELEKAVSSIGTPLYHQVFGDIYVEQQKWERAAGHYRRAVEKDPHRIGVHLGLGEVYFRQDKWDEATQEYRNELGVDPASASALARLAQIAILKGETGDALHTLSDAIQNGPERAADTLGLPPLPFSTAAESVREDARSRYRRSLGALRASPEGMARDLALAAVYLRLGLDEESQKEWQRFRAIAPPSAPAGDAHGRALDEFRRHEFEAAERDLESLVAARPADLEAHYLLGRTFAHLSLAVLGRILAIDANSARAHQMLAQTYDQQEESEKALVEYRIVEQMNPGLSGVHFAIGHLLWKLGEPDQAIPELQEELRRNPGHAEAHAELGTILVVQHDPDKAILSLKEALRLKPELSSAHQELGKALYQRKDLVRAEQELKKCLAPDPEGNVHYLLGMVYQGLGRTGESKHAFAESRRIKAERLAEKTIATAGERAR
jgi:tetratricopeptide (TPR) repeat protein